MTTVSEPSDGGSSSQTSCFSPPAATASVRSTGSRPSSVARSLCSPGESSTSAGRAPAAVPSTVTAAPSGLAQILTFHGPRTTGGALGPGGASGPGGSFDGGDFDATTHA